MRKVFWVLFAIALGAVIVRGLMIRGETSEVFNALQTEAKKKDSHELPVCQAPVKTKPAWSVFGCVIAQANSFHIPTSKEMAAMDRLLEGWLKGEGVSMLKVAKALNLQSCRMKQIRDDSLLLF